MVFSFKSPLGAVEHDDKSLPRHVSIQRVAKYALIPHIAILMLGIQIHAFQVLVTVKMQRKAGHFYISSTYLCRIFKQTTGFTLVEYLQDVRVQQARAYLSETNWKVTAIAEKTDFDSIAHFDRVFKQLTGNTPTP